MGIRYSSTDRFDLIVCFAIVIPIAVVSLILGDAGRGRAAAMAAAVMIIAARQTWESRYELWYWVLLLALIIAHVVLVVDISWSDYRLSYLGLLPFVAADYLVVHGIIRFSKMLFEKKA